MDSNDSFNSNQWKTRVVSTSATRIITLDQTTAKWLPVAIEGVTLELEEQINAKLQPGESFSSAVSPAVVVSQLPAVAGQTEAKVLVTATKSAVIYYTEKRGVRPTEDIRSESGIASSTQEAGAKEGEATNSRQRVVGEIVEQVIDRVGSQGGRVQFFDKRKAAAQQQSCQTKEVVGQAERAEAAAIVPSGDSGGRREPSLLGLFNS